MNGPTLLQDIDHILLNEQTLAEMRQSSLRLGIPTAAKKLYDLSVQLINRT